VHFVGVCGAGLSALALQARWSGWTVSGSDARLSGKAALLRGEGVRVFEGHDARHVEAAQELLGLPDAVVVSAAVPETNVEVRKALDLGVPVYGRDEWLSRVTEGYELVAVAGTHGKTTTSAMTAAALDALWGDTVAVVGGDIPQFPLGGGAMHGEGHIFVLEADEYARAFLRLEPHVAVLTNVELDHVDVYGSSEAFYDTFVEFVGNLQPGGALVANGEDAGCMGIVDAIGKDKRLAVSAGRNRKAVLVYGFSPDCDFAARDVAYEGGHSTSFDLLCLGQLVGKVTLQVPGAHNVLNSLAAIATATLLGVQRELQVEVKDNATYPSPAEVVERKAEALSELYLKYCAQAAAKLADFRGVKRRLEPTAERDAFLLVDDYAHHPSEVVASLETLRRLHMDRELWVIFEPHTYSRLNEFFADFAVAFNLANRVIVVDTYGARETPEAFPKSSKDLAEAVREHVPAEHIAGEKEVVRRLAFELGIREGTGKVVVVTMGAGTVTDIGGALLDALDGP